MIKVKGSGLLNLFCWVAFFIVILAAFNFWYSLRHYVNEPLGTDKTLNLKQDFRHHYRVKGKINDVSVIFFVDTGSSLVAVPEETAKKAGLLDFAKTRLMTAKGSMVSQLTVINSLKLGGIELKDVQGVILPHGIEGEVLLGMSALKYFNFRQKDGMLILSVRETK